MNGEVKAKEDTAMGKLKEGAVKKVASIKMGKTFLEFLEAVGVEVSRFCGRICGRKKKIPLPKIHCGMHLLVWYETIVKVKKYRTVQSTSYRRYGDPIFFIERCGSTLPNGCISFAFT